VTGARLKIGFETALKLLRCGSKVVVSTRFTEDARRRFANQPDFCNWDHRLFIFAADFRVLSCVRQLADFVRETTGTLDILINNAAQTLRRPPAYYSHLIEDHENATADPAHKVAITDRKCNELTANAFDAAGGSASTSTWSSKSVARLSQLALLESDEIVDPSEFPVGRTDRHGQQVDWRDCNSWMMTLAEVPWIELLEVMYINAIAPFLLTSNLQAVMKKDAGQRPSFVVNVTAMEGNFYDNKKDIRHPHTNMAKAALNMMTRTSANDLVKDRIYMNAVDPGWITNERPLLTNLLSEHGPMAIDEIDGASRICDPIFRALNDGDFSFGALFKNYKLFPW